jgi:hypothetical protein
VEVGIQVDIKRRSKVLRRSCVKGSCCSGSEQTYSTCRSVGAEFEDVNGYSEMTQIETLVALTKDLVHMYNKLPSLSPMKFESEMQTAWTRMTDSQFCMAAASQQYY